MDINRTVQYFVSTNYTNNACLDLINSRHYYSFNIQISFIQYIHIYSYCYMSKGHCSFRITDLSHI